MSNEVLSKLSTFKPQNTLSLEYRDKCPSLVPVMKVLPRLIENDQSIQTIDDQWRTLPMALAKHPNEKLSDLPVDTFW